MEAIRLSKTELTKKAKEIFYNFLVSSEDFFNGSEFEPCKEEYPTIVDMLYREFELTLGENANRIEMYKSAIEDQKDNTECVKSLKEQLNFLLKEREYFLNSNMEEQRKIYEEEHIIEYSRNSIRIPLDKKINSFYDEFFLEVLFYDDIAVPKGKYEEYKKLKTKAQRKAFVKANTEITHMGLSIIRGSDHIATIAIQGALNYKNKKVVKGEIALLDHKFCDFKSLKLADTNEIKNNDLKQLIQSKLYLDKEKCMVKLADKMVGNDNYQILEDTSGISASGGSFGWGNSLSNYYIRYICPSTKRVYFNNLNLRNLALSEYFKENNYDSYIDAWWSINNLGADPYGKAMVRC